jgi:hypothetical protein
MPQYVYGCKNKAHPRVTVVHPIGEDIILECEVCRGWMHRIPQTFLFGFPPIALIREWSERNWSKKLRGEPREEAYNAVATDRGKPQRDFYTRK